MFYLDTSFVIPLFINELTSKDVAAKLQTIPTGEVALSLWTKTEFSSVLARKVRMQESTEEFALETISKFEQIVRNSNKIRRFPTLAKGGLLNLELFGGIFFTLFLSQKKSSLTNAISSRNGICGFPVIFQSNPSKISEHCFYF